MNAQSNPKPKVEEIAPEYLGGEMLDNLLDFVAWMRANKMTPTFANQSKAGVNYISHICYLKLFRGYWYKRICDCCTVRFRSPNAKTLGIIKRVIEMRNSLK